MCRAYDTQWRDKSVYKILLGTLEEERSLGSLAPTREGNVNWVLKKLDGKA
jgi:hypothetical protein